MSTFIEEILSYAEAEFEGRSFNGLSLMATLERLTPEMALYEGTHEGYSAWTVALHVAYYKYFIAKAFGAAAPIEPYPFDKAEYGFGEPSGRDEAAWTAVKDYLRKAHAAAMGAIRAAGPEKLAETFPAWKISYGKAAAWLLSHDTFHAAQIRNMGVPGLKESKEH